MFDVKMSDDETIISVFYPPKRAACYSLIKNAPIKLIILLILIYYLALEFYSTMHQPAEKSLNNTLQSTRAIKAAQTQVVQISLPLEKNIKPADDLATSWHYSFEYRGDLSETKPYFLGFLSIILLLYFRSQINKQRALLAATSCTLTTKRIITQSSYPKQSVQSVNYSDQNHCTMMQTPLHWLLNIYFICLSESPVQNNMLNAIIQITTRSNDIVDILSPEHAERVLALFNKDPDSIPSTQEATSQPIELNQPRFPSSSGEKIVIKYNPRYMLLLIPHYFILYGFWYSLAIVILFIGTLFESGFLNLFTSRANIIKFMSAYVVFFMVIAYFRSKYLINKDEFVFANNELTLPQRPGLFIGNKTIPYKDISNLNISYSRFDLYQVHFIANLKQKVLSARNEYQTVQIELSIPGLSKENAEKILLLIQ